MARVRIVHTTEYTYRNPVGLLRHKLMIRPDESHDLRLHSAKLKVEPAPSDIYWKHDVFDNSICFLHWPEALRTRRLGIVSELDLTHHPEGQPLPIYSLDSAAEQFPYAYAAHEFPDLARFTQLQMPDSDRKVDAWARRVVSSVDSKETLRVLDAMTHVIKEEFRYVARHEEGTQTAAETLALGSGTCRDFAVLMMEALRCFGLAARFVTGYLYDNISGSVRGGGSTHAWCSVYLPGAGWVEYDPTNGLIAGENLIRVGVTREAEQAIPISGGFVGNADDPIALHVDVSVHAMPQHGCGAT
ncbi:MULTISPECIES: transglutaminase family protein [unclassified Bradyrhizobium]|uniref:transglutaminase family protein n=1 Tax=unclassified Bradyrhizobium TaxID=2631580 RepID=UPI001BA96D54|nr:MULTISPECIES: transglutaminase family protein [unclassified Bradyrhizobium]MBR1225924.1 transglutaminase family protein [Bradyrhizobium sp. AUGA SZCCT0176]MBR1296880.1 transglutaminase family protein [Bradyrhizobium sp. AUGA SZCCT0042]